MVDVKGVLGARQRNGNGKGYGNGDGNGNGDGDGKGNGGRFAERSRHGLRTGAGRRESA